MKPRSFATSLAALFLIGACAVPTEMPLWDMTWDIPVKSTTISVSSFLPTGVSIGSGNTFVVTTPPVSMSRALAPDCVNCVGTVPKPAFAQSIADSSVFPSGVGSATLATGSTVALLITNNLGFDPIRAPAAATNGWMRIVISNNGIVIGRDSVNGANGSLPVGTSTRQVPISGVITGSKRVAIALSIDSPAGSTPVAMDASRTIAISATPTVLVSSAMVSLTAPKNISSSMTFDLASLDSAITQRVSAATVILSITNPFAASGNLTANFTGGTSPVAKAITLDAGAPSAGVSTKSITLSGVEIRSLLGHEITMSLGGGVMGSNVSITPTSVVSVATRMRLNVSTKAQP